MTRSSSKRPAWRKGESGNPAGRPKGSGNIKQGLFKSKEPELQQKLINMALGGDVAAMKIIADRIWPRIRSQAMPINVAANTTDLANTGRSVIAAALDGEITVDVLRDVLAALYGQGKLVELTELEQRLQALEKQKDVPPWLHRSEAKLPIRGKHRRFT